MIMKRTFYVNPVPASRPRVTRWSTFYPKKYTNFKKDMETALTNVNFKPIESLVYAKIDFYINIPKSWSKKKKCAKINKLCDNNADLDNYCKAILDSLNNVYYVDDRQVAMIKARMFWSDQPRIECELNPISEDYNDKKGNVY